MGVPVLTIARLARLRLAIRGICAAAPPPETNRLPETDRRLTFLLSLMAPTGSDWPKAIVARLSRCRRTHIQLFFRPRPSSSIFAATRPHRRQDITSGCRVTQQPYHPESRQPAQSIHILRNDASSFPLIEFGQHNARYWSGVVSHGRPDSPHFYSAPHWRVAAHKFIECKLIGVPLLPESAWAAKVPGFPIR